jgi:hypothetical protein
MSDMFKAAMLVREHSRETIRDGLRLLMHSNPELVTWVLYELAAIKDGE